eukprot:gene29682-5095_t
MNPCRESRTFASVGVGAGGPSKVLRTAVQLNQLLMAFVGSVGTSVDEDFRIGTVRQTMKTNLLLTKAELGEVKKSTFSRAEPDHVFGYMAAKDPEGVREVTGIWKENTKTCSGGAGGTVGLSSDFKAMNKAAVISGVSTAKEAPAFRAAHPMTVQDKTFSSTDKSIHLPSDKNSKSTYGLPSAHRSAETIRDKGPEEPYLKHLIQNAYQGDWVAQSTAAQGKTGGAAYIPPVPTRAALGHAIGAQKYLQHGHGEEEWKMTKFKQVQPRVTQYMGATMTRNADSLDQFMTSKPGSPPTRERDTAVEMAA